MLREKVVFSLLFRVDLKFFLKVLVSLKIELQKSPLVGKIEFPAVSILYIKSQKHKKCEKITF